MDSAFITKAKKQLLEQQAALNEQVSDSSRQGTMSDDDPNTRFPQYGSSPDDNALEVSNYQDSISVQRGLRDELAQIARALQKIADGNYGVCDNCGQAISEDRLKIFPAATLCVSCSKTSA